MAYQETRMTHDVLTTTSGCSTAVDIWNAYLGGSGTNRPFGSVQLDGVDLDVEMADGAEFYADFVNKIKGRLPLQMLLQMEGICVPAGMLLLQKNHNSLICFGVSI